MLGLAIALSLQEQGFGTYGEDIFWNKSPVLASGSVVGDSGLWVNSLPESISGDLYTDNVTVSTRFTDPLKQGLYMLQLLNLFRTQWFDNCELTTKPISDVTFTNVEILKGTSVSLEAVDNEGKWVQAIRFQVRYKLPTELPPLESVSGNNSRQ